MSIILFDSECLLCNQSVQFILKHDRNEAFRFASLQSKVGQQLLKKHQFPYQYNESIILIENGKAYIKSTATLRIVKKLNGPWKLLYIFKFIPRRIRNIAYDYIAKNRYNWFGKQNTCMMMSPEIKRRFIDEF